MKKALTLMLAAVLLLVSLSFSSCVNKKAEYDTLDLFALDTFIEIKINKTEKSKEILEECKRIIFEGEILFDRTDEQSELYKLNSAEAYNVSERLFNVIRKAEEISASTDGSFDITAGALSELWSISDPDAPIPTDEQINDALEGVGYDKISLDGSSVSKNDGVIIDLGGIAKGEIAQSLLDYLVENGVEYGIVSLGGNVTTVGEKPNGQSFNVSLKDPHGNGSVGYITLDGGYHISVAGGYERNKTVDGVTYHHIFDTKTGYPADSDLACVAVVLQDGMTADALSTALFVMGSERALSYCAENGIFAVLIMNDGEIMPTQSTQFTFTEN